MIARRPERGQPRTYVDLSPIHGRGVFAARRIREGARIGEYLGPLTRRNGMHVLWIEDDDGNYVGIDGKNELRYLNHSATPNAFFDGTVLYAERDIDEAEEITFHYGDDWESVA